MLNFLLLTESNTEVKDEAPSEHLEESQSMFPELQLPASKCSGEIERVS